MSALLDAAFNLIHDYPGGAVALAPRIGKNATSLSHEAKRTGTAKLGLEDAGKLSAITGDLRILNAFAQMCNALVVPMPLGREDGDSFAQLGQLAREFADVVSAQSQAVADGRVSLNELHQVEREWYELVACGQRMLVRTRAMHEAGLPFSEREASTQAPWSTAGSTR